MGGIYLDKSNTIRINKLEKVDFEGKPFDWILPPSKSHLQRTLLLSSLASEKVIIEGINCLGGDSLTMMKCLNQMGASIEYDSDNSRIIVEENSRNELFPPNSVLNCENSATTLKLLLGFCSRYGVPIKFDGDATLRRRPLGNLLQELKSSGAEIILNGGENSLPLTIEGPICPREYQVDVSQSSQPLSSLIISGMGATKSFRIRCTGEPVSKNHSELTIRLCLNSGAIIERIGTSELTINPWTPFWEEPIYIPGDASLSVYCMLWSALHNEPIMMHGWPNLEDTLGCYILEDIAENIGINWEKCGGENILLSPLCNNMKPVEVNLQDSIDILPALAALLSISNGGVITGISHAAIKESNRIIETQKILSKFGIKSDFERGSMNIPGNQKITKPTSIIKIPYDHRIEMLSIILGSAVDASIETNNSYLVTDPMFIERLNKIGLSISKS